MGAKHDSSVRYSDCKSSGFPGALISQKHQPGGFSNITHTHCHTQAWAVSRLMNEICLDSFSDVERAEKKQFFF